MVRTTATAAPPETAVLRLIGLLPADWECWQRVGKDRITLRVRGGGGRDSGMDMDVDVRGVCAVVLRDRALEGWAIESGGRP